LVATTAFMSSLAGTPRARTLGDKEGERNVTKRFTQPFEHTDLDLHLDPWLTQHPDAHDGWGAIRARQVEPDTRMARAAAQDGNVITTCADHARLRSLIGQSRHLGVPARVLERLRSELDVAERVCASEVGDDVVTMNSQIIYEDERARAQRRVQLVYPEQVRKPHHVSVLDSLGTGLLGLRVGQRLGALPTGSGGALRPVMA
jgi:hypothetical protein